MDDLAALMARGRDHDGNIQPGVAGEEGCLLYTSRKDWKTPTRSLTPAVLGSAVFYWCVRARFMENSSSWHRLAPTAMVWQLLAGLMFLSALARALYLPGTSDGRTLCAGGYEFSFALGNGKHIGLCE